LQCILPCFWGEAVLGDMLMIHQYNDTSAYSNTALGSKALYNQRENNTGERLGKYNIEKKEKELTELKAANEAKNLEIAALKEAIAQILSRMNAPRSAGN